jgi:hypothetical protein
LLFIYLIYVIACTVNIMVISLQPLRKLSIKKDFKTLLFGAAFDKINGQALRPNYPQHSIRKG